MVSDSTCDVAVCDIKGRGDFSPTSDFGCTSYIQNLCLHISILMIKKMVQFTKTFNTNTLCVCTVCTVVYGRTVHKKIQYLCGFQRFCVRYKKTYRTQKNPVFMRLSAILCTVTPLSNRVY